MIEAIRQRRSIRFFLPDPISDENLREILTAGQWAPSPKNRQPWRFIVVRGEAKRGMDEAMKAGLEKTARGEGPLAGRSEYLPNAVYTQRVMQAAPVTLFIYDSEGRSVYEPMSPADRIHEMSNVQAIGAAIQNMALAAWDMGIGSLWNGNIFFAYDELKEWLGEPGEIIAALSLGYTRRPVCPLPRKPLEELVSFK